VGLPTTTKQVVFSRVYCSQLPKDPFFPPIPFDSTLVAPFLQNPKVQIPETRSCPALRKHNYEFLWYDSNGMNEFAALLYSKVNNLEQEGIKTRALCGEITNHFSGLRKYGKSDVE
jgi:hypothetical protein